MDDIKKDICVLQNEVDDNLEEIRDLKKALFLIQTQVGAIAFSLNGEDKSAGELMEKVYPEIEWLQEFLKT